jgi:hypothetical protein
VTTGFQNVVEADNVRLDISIRIGDAAPHTGLCSKVHHNIEGMFGKQSFNQGLIGQIPLHEKKPWVLQLLETPLLQRNIVIVTEVVETDDSCPRFRM